ncbi:hypothetical protein D7V80_22700 [Corallococcus sp. CA054B]|nr:hypothetical protein D7V80_22700 [Corallococcus sp. CA054B]
MTAVAALIQFLQDSDCDTQFGSPALCNKCTKYKMHHLAPMGVSRYCFQPLSQLVVIGTAVDILGRKELLELAYIETNLSPIIWRADKHEPLHCGLHKGINNKIDILSFPVLNNLSNENVELFSREAGLSSCRCFCACMKIEAELIVDGFQ